jgi:alanine dehydrogenase
MAPLAMMNDGILHHLRVAVGAALDCATWHARTPPSSACSVRHGARLSSGFGAVRNISKVKVYSPRKVTERHLPKSMGRELGIPVEPFDRPESVLRGSDIVATCTDSNKLVVTDPDWIERHALGELQLQGVQLGNRQAV